MEEMITICIFKDAKKLPSCQWRHMINDVPMCWRNCAGCIYGTMNVEGSVHLKGDSNGQERKERKET
jgi:hypothetical protein